jgi:hypothetical protein
MSRWIDVDAIKGKAWKAESEACFYALEDVVSVTDIEEAPSIDIVRCQDCKYWVYNFNGCSRNPCTEPWYATDFCSYGEREGE